MYRGVCETLCYQSLSKDEDEPQDEKESKEDELKDDEKSFELFMQ